MLQEAYNELLEALTSAARSVYAKRLVALVVFGSVGRRTQRFDSDVDLLVVVEDLPNGRRHRLAEFEAVEERVAPVLRRLAARGVDTSLSPLFKSPAELEAASFILLDMVEDARVLYDPTGIFARRMDRLRRRLAEFRAERRHWCGGRYWVLKPDLKPGEVIEL